MRTFLHLLRWDLTLLNRNQVLSISVLVTGIYLGLFWWLQQFMVVDQLLVLVIFNDPALLGFLFIGVMVLFEKNEGTLQALVVTPVAETYYLWSKITALTLISLLCCYGLVGIVHGLNFHWLHFGVAAAGTTVFFGLLGFILVSGVDTFNQYIMRSVGLLILLSLPFIGYFGVLPMKYFVWIPIWPALELFSAAFRSAPAGSLVLYYLLLLAWNIIAYVYALRAFRKNIKR
ncbi:MAG: hypothetical protein R2806_12710 [Saprospiraceae bacterium]